MAGQHGYPRRQRVRETAAARYAPAPSPSGLTGILLDSDVIIEAPRGRRDIGDAIWATERGGVPTYCCAVSFAEIWAGLRPGEEAVTEAFFHARGDVALDAVVGRRAGGYLSRYARSHGLEMADAPGASPQLTVAADAKTARKSSPKTAKRGPTRKGIRQRLSAKQETEPPATTVAKADVSPR